SKFSTTSGIDASNVGNPAPVEVYQTERFGNFAYTFSNLQEGKSYLVRIHFAEIFFTDPGKRLFSVTINGDRVLNEFDIFAAAGGPNRAVVQEFTVQPDRRGRIILLFANGSQNNAECNGIEIYPAS